MKTIKDIISELAFFRDLSDEKLDFIAGCGQNMHFKPGAYISKENGPADYLFIITKGNVAVQLVHPVRGPITLRSLKDGEVAGWSWIIPPFRMLFDLKAMDHTSVVALDGKCVRAKCEEDERLGFILMRESARVMNKRLEDTRMQLLDMYSARV